MPSNEKENNEKKSKIAGFNPEDKRNLVGFFELLMKVDRRVNPHIYQRKS